MQDFVLGGVTFHHVQVSWRRFWFCGGVFAVLYQGSLLEGTGVLVVVFVVVCGWAQMHSNRATFNQTTRSEQTIHH